MCNLFKHLFLLNPDPHPSYASDPGAPPPPHKMVPKYGFKEELGSLSVFCWILYRRVQLRLFRFSFNFLVKEVVEMEEKFQHFYDLILVLNVNIQLDFCAMQLFSSVIQLFFSAVQLVLV